MKIRVEMEIDMSTGTYDVRFHNLTSPGEDIDLAKLARVVNRVLDNVAVKTTRVETTPLFPSKSDVN
jgi:hypothetical protein